jgi:hypothetical protein
MIELFAGALIGASLMLLGLHFSHRLKPRQPQTYTGSDVGISAVSVDLAGNNGPMVDVHYKRMLDPILANLEKERV